MSFLINTVGSEDKEKTDNLDSQIGHSRVDNNIFTKVQPRDCLSGEETREIGRCRLGRRRLCVSIESGSQIIKDSMKST
jgi:hypothetical protein